MASLLNQLSDPNVWLDFYREKDEKGHLSADEKKQLTAFIEKEAYHDITERLNNGNYRFPLPRKALVNKGNTGKKRVVYQFPPKESWVLKLLGQLLYRYDYVLCDSCYSFRKRKTAGMAIRTIQKIPQISKKYCVKIDIHDYFNSIPSEHLVKLLNGIIIDDPELLEFLSVLLLENKAVFQGKIVEEDRGAMAGMPLSPFFANVYLTSLDQLFADYEIPYFRYSDDIIFFVDSIEQVDHYTEILKEHISAKGLAINEKKHTVSAPEEPWEFLGFQYHKGVIDLSENTKYKIKGKIRRKAKSLYRWRIEKDVSFQITARFMIRKFNHKFYSKGDRDFSWSRWFFPVLTTSDGLKEIDQYYVEYLRYLYTGRHYKGNYKITYEQIKKLGFRSLVNEYYKEKKLRIPDNMTTESSV